MFRGVRYIRVNYMPDNDVPAGTFSRFGMGETPVPAPRPERGGNRFAHAAAMTVVESPGTICNQLLLAGERGSGKTRFVNFIAHSLSVSKGAGKVLLTDGAKFSRGLEEAANNGGLEALEAALAGLTALVIDDVHLLAVSEKNRELLGKWLNLFVGPGRQLVLASGLPASELEGLGCGLGFNFSRGWSASLKAPAPEQVCTPQPC